MHNTSIGDFDLGIIKQKLASIKPRRHQAKTADGKESEQCEGRRTLSLLRQGQCTCVIDHSEALPTPVRLLRLRARRKMPGALLANDAKTLRELIDLIKSKGDDLQRSRRLKKRSIATHVNSEFRAEPSEYARDRSEQINQARESSQRRVLPMD